MEKWNSGIVEKWNSAKKNSSTLSPFHSSTIPLSRREIIKAGAGLAAIIAAGKAPAALVKSMLGMRGAMMSKKPSVPSSEYWGLCFTAETAGATISMTKVGDAPSVSLQTSTDGVSWLPFSVGDMEITLANVGDKVYFSAGDGGNVAFASSISNFNNFVVFGRVAASGSIMSLIDGASQMLLIPASYCFTCLFHSCTGLTSAPELPATTITMGCYTRMFYECPSLKKAPTQLPAKTARGNCYSSMFNGCSELQNAPELFVETLSTGCYNYIFSSCSKINRIKVHHTRNWSNSYTTRWVEGVAASGTFICPSALPHGSSDFGVGKIPTGWTVETF